jgi:hypothetical protein
MRTTLPLTFAALLALASAAAGASTLAERGRIDVEFLADGRCRVSATGETFHSTLTYTPQATASAAGRRCAIPPVPDGTPVDLVVSLPRGTAHPPGDAIPSLTWTRQDDRWIGTAALTTAPSVVRIPAPRDLSDLRADVIRMGAWCSAAALVFAWLSWRRTRAA